ncbi:MAG: hypothetical protein SCH68_11445 [Brevefilum sp.]|nr:hypothetical protein [Brevefilum sp.]
MDFNNNSLPYRQTFSENNCFLCGKNILDKYSLEHVFPRWLQRKFDLWNQEINLLNKSSIQYRYLQVPCCQTCNNKYLSKIETIVHNGVNDGFDSFRNIEEPIIFQWIGKIFYSLLYKELTLLFNRSDPSYGNINTDEYVESFNGLHSLLQSSRYPTKFELHFPWSIFIFKLKPFCNNQAFDFSDDSDRGAVKIRMNDIGIIACLMDHGTVKKTLIDWFSCLNERTLHPIQFDELAAIVFYQNSLLGRNPKLVNIVDNNLDEPQLSVCPLPIGGFSLKPIFNSWDMDHYLVIFSNFVNKYGYSYSDLVKGDDFCSFTFEPDGSFHQMITE